MISRRDKVISLSLGQLSRTARIPEYKIMDALEHFADLGLMQKSMTDNGTIYEIISSK